VVPRSFEGLVKRGKKDKDRVPRTRGDETGGEPGPLEKRALIPSFDREDLEEEIEREAAHSSQPFDIHNYSRIVDEPPIAPAARAMPKPLTAATVWRPGRAPSPGSSRTRTTVPPARMVSDTVPQAPGDVAFDDEALGREMYGCYLASNFPEALVLAERVLE